MTEKKGIGMIRIFLRQMRIKSWLKNLFVLFPIVFSLELFQTEILVQAIALTFAFCLISSAVYTLNDVHDVEKDRKHAIKKNRPIAARQLSIPAAFGMIAFLTVGGFAMAFLVNLPSFLLMLAYFLINVLYSRWLKTIAIIDCFCIAAGFVLRVMVGGTIVENGVSQWMFLTVVALSLFMAFGKRRGEKSNYGEGSTRNVLETYEMRFLDGVVFTCAGLAVVFYSLWSMAQGSGMVYTVPIILFIVMRYLLLVFRGSSEADPTTLILSDVTLLASCGICGLTMLFILYGAQFF